MWSGYGSVVFRDLLPQKLDHWGDDPVLDFGRLLVQGIGDAGGVEAATECLAVDRDYLTSLGDELRRRLAELDARRQRGEAVVFTNGCFDLLHSGHLSLLRQAAELGDALVLAVNSDASAGVDPVIPRRIETRCQVSGGADGVLISALSRR